MILEGLLSTLAGGALRLAPEVITAFDRKNERAHEIKMQELSMQATELEIEAKQAGARLDAEVSMSQADISAIIEATKVQGQKSGVGWVDALNALVRPTLALWWGLFLYTGVLIAKYVMLQESGLSAATAVVTLWGPDEVSIASAVIGFFFVNRALIKR